jgi:hypothetical protein
MGSAELLLVGGLFSAAFAVYSFVSALMSNSQTEKDMLQWASGNEPIKSKSALVNWSRPLVHQFTVKYAIRYKNPRSRKKIAKLIMTSGLSRELNVDEFIGMQFFWGIMVPILFAGVNFALEMGFSPVVFALIAPAGCLSGLTCPFSPISWHCQRKPAWILFLPSRELSTRLRTASWLKSWELF